MIQLMNKLIIAFAVTVTILGGLTFGLASDFVKDSPSALKSGALALGHLTLTAYDENGNVIAYQQTDNTVTNKGDDCMAQLIFVETTPSGNCAGEVQFSTVHIGTSTAAFAETSNNLGAYHAETNPLTVVITAASDTGGADTLLTANFLNVNANIAEASIQTGSATGSDALALQSFSAIPLGANDDLTIQWTVTVDGT